MPANETPQPTQPQPEPSPPAFDNLELVGSDTHGSIREDRDSKKEQNKLFGEPKRREQFHQAVHYVRLVILCVVVLVGLAAFVVRALHFILPENNAANAGAGVHGWLTEAQLGSMDKFVFGALSAFLAQYMRRALIAGLPKSAADDNA